MKTPKASDLRVGQWLHNNDPRQAGKVGQDICITAIEEGRVAYHSGTRKCYISLGRIYTDGGVRHQGYNT